MLKQWLQASQAQLRTYEWVETTVITKGGEEKSRKQNTVYYGADGKLQKVPVAGGAESKSGGPPGPLLKKGAEKQEGGNGGVHGAGGHAHALLRASRSEPHPAGGQYRQVVGHARANACGSTFATT